MSGTVKREGTGGPVPQGGSAAGGVLGRLDGVEELYVRLRHKQKYLSFGAQIGADEYAEFATSCLAVIADVCGQAHAFYVQALRVVGKAGGIEQPGALEPLHGIVRAVRGVAGDGTLETWRAQERAAVLGAVIDQAERLASASRLAGAAAVAGSALVVHLRLLAARHAVQEGAALSEVLGALADAGVLSAQDAAAVSAWLAVWNRAVGGRMGAVTRDGVAGLVAGACSFIARNPA